MDSMIWAAIIGVIGTVVGVVLGRQATVSEAHLTRLDDYRAEVRGLMLRVLDASDEYQERAERLSLALNRTAAQWSGPDGILVTSDAALPSLLRDCEISLQTMKTATDRLFFHTARDFELAGRGVDLIENSGKDLIKELDGFATMRSSAGIPAFEQRIRDVERTIRNVKNSTIDLQAEVIQRYEPVALRDRSRFWLIRLITGR